MDVMAENVENDEVPKSYGFKGSTSGSAITHNRLIITIIVYLALLLDNILLTVIVPILPDYLATIDKSQQSLQPYDKKDIPLQNLVRPVFETALFTSKKALINFTVKQETEDKVIIAPAAVVSSFALQSPHTAAAKYSDDGRDSQSFNDDTLTSENGSIGILLAMKALMQLIFNPIVGNMSTKFGYRLPIVFGTLCLLISALGGSFSKSLQARLIFSYSVFAIGETYVTLLIARAVQGIGSACIGVCGMSLVAQLYPEEDRRSRIMGIILGSIALGVLLGYPFGGITYDLIGKSAPFIILSIIIFLNLGMQLLTMDLSVQPEVTIGTENGPKWTSILQNKMVLAIVIAIWFSTSTMAILEPCLPIWLLQHLKPYKWQLGTVFIPDSVGYFIGTNFFGTFAYNYGQIKISCISLFLVGVSSILIPNATTVLQLLLPHFGLGLGIGIVDAALVPLLATFVDASLGDEESVSGAGGRDSMSSYGTVYAIQQTSVSLAYCLAPLLGGELVQILGFPWLMRIVGFFNIVYGPILVLLNQRYNPTFINEKRNQLLLANTGEGSASQYKKLYNAVDME